MRFRGGRPPGQAHDLVRKHWPQIMRVAEALYESGTLTQDQLDALMSTKGGRSSAIFELDLETRRRAMFVGKEEFDQLCKTSLDSGCSPVLACAPRGRSAAP